MQLPVVDQDHMLAVRQAWFAECGAPPPGNKLALERKAWQVGLGRGEEGRGHSGGGTAAWHVTPGEPVFEA